MAVGEKVYSACVHPSAPILFYKPLSSMIGPNAPIYVPKVAQPVEVHLSDYEVELTIVIGKTAKDVSEAEALDYVLGYTGANDVRVSYISADFRPRCVLFFFFWG